MRLKTTTNWSLSWWTKGVSAKELFNHLISACTDNMCNAKCTYLFSDQPCSPACKCNVNVWQLYPSAMRSISRHGAQTRSPYQLWLYIMTLIKVTMMNHRQWLDWMWDFNNTLCISIFSGHYFPDIDMTAHLAYHVHKSGRKTSLSLHWYEIKCCLNIGNIIKLNINHYSMPLYIFFLNMIIFIC